MVKSEIKTSLNEFESVFKALNVQYDGDQDNDLKVTSNRTETGAELHVIGKGKANYTENIAKESSMTRNDVALVLDSVVDARLNQNRKERAEAVIDSFKSDTDKKKTDTSFWGYTIIGSVLVVGVCVALVLNRLKV